MQIEKFKKIVRVVHKASRSTLNFIKKDSAQQWFVFTIVLFTTLSSTSAFAQTSDLPTCIDPSYSYVNVKANKLNSGFNDQVLDNYDDSGNEIASLLGNMVFSIEPTLGCNYTAMLEEYPDLDGFARNGLNGTLENMNMAMLNNPPSTDVIAHLANEWVPGYEGVNTSVYAQDGFDVLQSINISDLWDKIRLLSYSFFVIALIAAGFMIMFRHKIGGQMAVTIFNTIPRIILGLILVTFSFAIVGIMIDFGAMLINVITGILGLTDPLVVGDPLSLVGLLFRGTDGIGISGFGGWITDWRYHVDRGYSIPTPCTCGCRWYLVDVCNFGVYRYHSLCFTKSIYHTDESIYRYNPRHCFSTNISICFSIAW